jgi:hypothetical protein
MEEVLLLASALVLGFLHGLGADHLMAIAALSIGATGEAPALRRARAMGVAVRFAIGHALLLALGAGGLIVLGWSLPLVVERSGVVSTATRTSTGASRRRTSICTSAALTIIRRRLRTRTCPRLSARRSPSAACAH